MMRSSSSTAFLPGATSAVFKAAPSRYSPQKTYTNDVRLDPKPPSVDEYLHLREASGLSPKPRAAAERGLAGTWFGVTLRDAQGGAIAMGRIVGDGGCFFQVVDIAVLPAHQRRGYGARIVEALMNELRIQAPRGAYVSLLADGEAPRPKRRALELAPAFWKQTLEQQDTQQRLAANVFRTATLVDHAPPV